MKSRIQIPVLASLLIVGMLTAAGTGHAQSFSGEALVKALQKGGASPFHQHFKAVTSMSPLQFQKVLRLQEARRLMFSMMMDVNTASLKVG